MLTCWPIPGAEPGRSRRTCSIEDSLAGQFFGADGDNRVGLLDVQASDARTGNNDGFFSSGVIRGGGRLLGEGRRGSERQAHNEAGKAGLFEKIFLDHVIPLGRCICCRRQGGPAKRVVK